MKKILKTAVLALVLLSSSAIATSVHADDEGYYTGGYDGGYYTGGYDGGYVTEGYDGGYYTGGYDGGYLTGGYDEGYLTGGYDGGYMTEGYDGGYFTDGYDDGYYTGSYGEQYYSSGGYSSPQYSSGGYYSGGSGYSTPRYTSGGYYSGGSGYSSPISVSSGRSYTTPTYTTPVVTTQAAPVHNNNNNTNNNTNVNNINVSATAIAIAPAATPVAAYIPPAPVYVPPAPHCTITVTNQYGLGYGLGQQTVTWNSTNAHSASISPIIGSVTTNGSRVVSYLGGQVYTMTVWGPGGSATCQTQPMYAPVPVPSAPYVALTQIPYTGFDYGPIGNAMYWVSLISVAVAGAYLMVYYRGGMMAFASSMIGGRENRSSRLAEFTPLPESAFAPAKARVQEVKVAQGNTVDAMSFARAENGLPKIVISRS